MMTFRLGAPELLILTVPVVVHVVVIVLVVKGVQR